MKRRDIIGIGAVMLIGVLAIHIQSIIAMWELTTKEKTPGQQQSQSLFSQYYSSKNFPTFRTLTALKASEETLAQEEAKKLAPGVYPKASNQGCRFYQLALENIDRQEENITCGARVLVIAKAIDMLAAQNTPITPASIHEQLEALGYDTEISHCTEQLYSTDFAPKMEKNNNKLMLNSWLILGSQEGMLIPQPKTDEEDLEIVNLLQEAEDIPATIGKLVNELFGKWFSLSPAKRTSHCFCTDRVSGHWFLISAVHAQGTITLWYIDPKNIDYDQYPPAHLFMNHICDKKPRLLVPKLKKFNWGQRSSGMV